MIKIRQVLKKWEQIYTRRLLESAKCNVDEDVIAEQRKVDELEESWRQSPCRQRLGKERLWGKPSTNSDLINSALEQSLFFKQGT
ncbi:hypothetical protein OSTOST_10482 [Ostertagia ostertagi]